MTDYVYKRHHCHMVRMVLEAATPLAIGSGQGDGVYDQLLVRDPNGYPGIPGTAMAGVLRHLFLKQFGEKEADDLFGRGEDRLKSPASSRLHVSWGFIHNRNDQPMDGLQINHQQRKAAATDALLGTALETTPLRRDHVRLNHRGAALDSGQFDRAALHAGYRFSVELTCWSQVPRDPQMDRLKTLFGNPLLRLGGGVRSGFGAMKVVRAYERSWDLTEPDQFKSYSKVLPDLGDCDGWSPLPVRPVEKGVAVTLNLQPEDGFRFGGGNEPLYHENDNDPLLVPVTEPVVRWDESGMARFSDRQILIPASGVKGALRHRFAFHYNRIKKHWAHQVKSRDTDQNAGVTALFGFMADRQEDGFHPGHLFFDDLHLPMGDSCLTLTHNGLDRFTGGVRQQVLFSEQVVNNPLKLTLQIDESDHPDLRDEKLRQALGETLADVAEGRLALGSGGSRGWGFFKGTATWSDGNRWILGGGS